MERIKGPKDIMPTLVIGLGGTGFQVIKRLKKMFAKRYSADTSPIRYLVIDTDLKSFLDEDIKNSEKCQLRLNDGIKNTLDWAYENENFDWLPQNPKIIPDFFTATDQGAGLIRPIGRLYLCKNAKLVYESIKQAKDDLVDLHKILTYTDDSDIEESYLQNIEKHKVYIVGSLAGGTGCGTFLDTSVMVSNIFNRDNTNVIGMFTLQSCYDEKLSSDLDAQNRSKANCYAALKELEFYMSTITDPDNDVYKFKYNNIEDIRLQKKLLDICYLVENKNEKGGVLTNVENIYDLCSLQLFQEIGTELGSQLRADYANFICKDKDPILNRERNFSTFSSASMEVPVESIKKYTTFKLAQDILRKISTTPEKTERLEVDIKESIRELEKTIKKALQIEKVSGEFINDYSLEDETYGEAKEKVDSLKDLEDKIKGRIKLWNENKKQENQIEKILKAFINKYSLIFGLENMENCLHELVNKFLVSEDFKNGKYTAADISRELDSVKVRGFKKKEKKIPNEFIDKYDDYLKYRRQYLNYEIKTDLYDLVKKYVQREEKALSEARANIANQLMESRKSLEEINYKTEIKYGGNIISRDMITKEFYDEYYKEHYEECLDNKIEKIFKNKSIFEIINSGQDELIKICKNDFEEVSSSLNIMEIFKNNSKSKGIDINEYVRKELEVTAHMAKPFWSAKKNPEVSWTKCYYIGSIKDDTSTGNVQAHLPIDKWIRSQTGEKSVRARYVETINPYSIDVTNITMGACAAYLPDVKSYRSVYLKTLSNKTYPLHLNENYIGFEELDEEGEKILNDYVLAQVYGAIVKVEDNYVLNISKTEDGFKYIYHNDSCLVLEDQEREDLPKVISFIDDKLLLAKSERDLIEKLESKKLKILIKGFIKFIEGRVDSERLILHKEKAFDEGVLNSDFIIAKKVTFQNMKVN